jgi:hypothetical protein
MHGDLNGHQGGPTQLGLDDKSGQVWPGTLHLRG